jgi:glutamine cyclotransferase
MDGQQFTSGQVIPVSIEILSDTVELDSAGFYLSGRLAGMLYEGPFDFSHATMDLPVGSLRLRVICWYAGGRDVHNLEAVLLSDIQPVDIPYSIVNTYSHDTRAYTQGLVFRDGFLYEGTGMLKESSLRKVIIESGEVLRMLSLPGDIFGEGITIFNDRIYQLTYRSQVGFVYDLESFQRLQKVYYQNKEGWGLTHDGEHLIMSDGSHKIYYMDPEYFTELRQLEVYDENGPVTRLNELEYIEGKIFANIHGQEVIVIIDPLTGKVTGRLNMTGILTEPEGDRRRDVFNGIAWDPERRLMYVTGKYWPSLFEVRLNADF